MAAVAVVGGLVLVRRTRLGGSSEGGGYKGNRDSSSGGGYKGRSSSTGTAGEKSSRGWGEGRPASGGRSSGGSDREKRPDTGKKKKW